ncbi:MAG TPA: Hsp20/alpha crystallin family protein [Nevskiaceae bacterium]|nr:Hsp20/alpha crystallin family protein [Nevskiaceae bacterium]
MAKTNVETTVKTSKGIVPQEVSQLPSQNETMREIHLQPAVDIVEDAKGITLYADLPGVNRDGLNLRVEGESLVIEGTSKLELPKGAKPVYAEQRALSFRRRFTLSTDLDAEKIEAKLANGVLMLRIPKTQAAQPRQIEVKVG